MNAAASRVAPTPISFPANGRGLHVIAATTTWWGWCGDASGRTVTALFT